MPRLIKDNRGQEDDCEGDDEVLMSMRDDEVVGDEQEDDEGVDDEGGVDDILMLMMQLEKMMTGFLDLSWFLTGLEEMLRKRMTLMMTKMMILSKETRKD